MVEHALGVRAKPLLDSCVLGSMRIIDGGFGGSSILVKTPKVELNTHQVQTPMALLLVCG